MAMKMAKRINISEKSKAKYRRGENQQAAIGNNENNNINNGIEIILMAINMMAMAKAYQYVSRQSAALKMAISMAA